MKSFSMLIIAGYLFSIGTGVYASALTGNSGYIYQETKEQRDRDRELIDAIKDGDINVVTLLVAEGAEINLEDNDGWTPLMVAIVEGRTEIAKLLISMGADINAVTSNMWTPLMVAIMCGQTEVARLLIERGADVNATDNDGYTVLRVALEYKQTEIVKLLLKKRAVINTADNNDRNTPLEWAIRCGRMDIVRLLVAEGSEIIPEVQEIAEKYPELRQAIEEGLSLKAQEAHTPAE